VTRFYCNFSVISPNRLSLLLLSVTMTPDDITRIDIAVVALGSNGLVRRPRCLVATKGHNSDLPISATSLAEGGTGLYKYLFTSSALRRWLPRIH
jgi:hypothetical protein